MLQGSSEINEISKALNKAQKLMGAAKKGAANPFFKSKYADLNSILEACKGPLNDNGITIIQPHSTRLVTNADGTTEMADFVDTVFLHESGQYLSSSTRVIIGKKNDAQALGSSISYSRRYGLQSFISLPAEDDDGEKATVRTTTTASTGGYKKKAKKVAVSAAVPTNVAVTEVAPTGTTIDPSIIDAPKTERKFRRNKKA